MNSTRRTSSALLASSLILLCGASALRAGGPGGLQGIQPVSRHERIDNVSHMPFRPLTPQPITVPPPVWLCALPNTATGASEEVPLDVRTPSWRAYRGTYTDEQLGVNPCPKRSAQ